MLGGGGLLLHQGHGPGGRDREPPRDEVLEERGLAYIDMYIRIYIYIYIYIIERERDVYTCVCIYIYIYSCTYTCTYTCTYVCIICYVYT